MKPSIFDLTGKVAVVTGACGLLGREHVDVLAEAGAYVVVTDIRIEAGKSIAKSIEETHGVQVLPIEVDVSEKESVQSMVEQVLTTFGRIDVLINNASLTVKGGTENVKDYFAPFEEYSLDSWNNALRVNLTGTFLCSQMVGGHMAKSGGGVIINICSTYGIVGPDQRLYEGLGSPYDPSVRFNTPASYSATKGAILALTRYLATYWAEKNVRVNALSPGGVFDNHDEAFVKRYSLRTPMARMAKKSEYRGAILFLASDASSYMTGSNVVVDGGWTAW